ncbi:hypothetical protein [Streptomyces sp. BK340]|uniref:DUF6197 family protein n=1 Tax=Streptomyces sp. BK340 TaxID=2572903 RepID=UPI0011A1B689|nr:hypothetical protein [Streptomyces sp. BK340]TVZ96455.1 hypothetical protein FB157_103366 [Streptomyces sp. BK340]
MSTSSQTRSVVIPLQLSPQARPTTVPAVFRAAARLLAANGHHQGDYCPDPFDRVLKSSHAERPLSIVAAVRCVVSGSPHRETPLSEAAVKVLAGRLEVDGEPAWNDEAFWLEMHVAAWGDVEGRTTESAVAVLEAAADACEVAA